LGPTLKHKPLSAFSKPDQAYQAIPSHIKAEMFPTALAPSHDANVTSVTSDFRYAPKIQTPTKRGFVTLLPCYPLLRAPAGETSFRPLLVLVLESPVRFPVPGSHPESSCIIPTHPDSFPSEPLFLCSLCYLLFNCRRPTSDLRLSPQSTRRRNHASLDQLFAQGGNG